MYTVLCIFTLFTQDEYQQLDDKMRQQAIEYEEKLKTTEAKVNWSHVSML